MPVEINIVTEMKRSVGRDFRGVAVELPSNLMIVEEDRGAMLVEGFVPSRGWLRCVALSLWIFQAVQGCPVFLVGRFSGDRCSCLSTS